MVLGGTDTIGLLIWRCLEKLIVEYFVAVTVRIRFLPGFDRRQDTQTSNLIDHVPREVMVRSVKLHRMRLHASHEVTITLKERIHQVYDLSLELLRERGTGTLIITFFFIFFAVTLVDQLD